MDLQFVELMKTAAVIADETMRVKKGDNVLILTDTRVGNYPGSQALGQALAAALAERGVDYNMMTFTARNKKGADIPEQAVAFANMSDYTVFIVSQSIIYTTAFRKIVATGTTRVVELPLGQDVAGTDDIFYTLPTTKEEFHKIADLCDAVGEKLLGEKTFRLLGDNGTDLTFKAGQLKCFMHDGHAHELGAMATFPFGTFAMGLDPGSANGKLVFDSRFAPVAGRMKDSITFTVENGCVTALEGGVEAAKLEALLNSMPYSREQTLNIAEFGLGFDKAVTLDCKDIGVAEHVYGAAHIGMGANVTFGGDISIPWHVDGMIANATVYVDGDLIVKNGEYIL